MPPHSQSDTESVTTVISPSSRRYDEILDEITHKYATQGTETELISLPLDDALFILDAGRWEPDTLLHFQEYLQLRVRYPAKFYGKDVAWAEDIILAADVMSNCDYLRTNPNKTVPLLLHVYAIARCGRAVAERIDLDKFVHHHVALRDPAGDYDATDAIFDECDDPSEYSDRYASDHVSEERGSVFGGDWQRQQEAYQKELDIALKHVVTARAAMLEYVEYAKYPECKGYTADDNVYTERKASDYWVDYGLCCRKVKLLQERLDRFHCEYIMYRKDGGKPQSLAPPPDDRDTDDEAETEYQKLGRALASRRFISDSFSESTIGGKRQTTGTERESFDDWRSRRYAEGPASTMSVGTSESETIAEETEEDANMEIDSDDGKDPRGPETKSPPARTREELLKKTLLRYNVWVVVNWPRGILYDDKSSYEAFLQEFKDVKAEPAQIEQDQTSGKSAKEPPYKASGPIVPAGDDLPSHAAVLVTSLQNYITELQYCAKRLEEDRETVRSRNGGKPDTAPITRSVIFLHRTKFRLNRLQANLDLYQKELDEQLRMLRPVPCAATIAPTVVAEMAAIDENRKRQRWPQDSDDLCLQTVGKPINIARPKPLGLSGSSKPMKLLQEGGNSNNKSMTTMIISGESKTVAQLFDAANDIATYEDAAATLSQRLGAYATWMREEAGASERNWVVVFEVRKQALEWWRSAVRKLEALGAAGNDDAAGAAGSRSKCKAADDGKSSASTSKSHRCRSKSKARSKTRSKSKGRKRSLQSESDDSSQAAGGKKRKTDRRRGRAEGAEGSSAAFPGGFGVMTVDDDKLYYRV
ncbi:Uu.00g052420.m01.CDS01 [Anthostomella pinea]|uniref:Uu.00g052420.m01.CDS01 n=1 Tax=Anthostomella pinea TaxID=933095 RepID=A0AAI8YM15_9PEZI|nr:Uu.00g052420.m01.CDS01 [Anthostomella pinea]